MTKPPPISGELERGVSAFGGRAAADLVPRRRVAGPVPWVIAIMIMLSTLAAGAALALSNLAGSARSELSGAVTVQVIEADRQLRDAQAARVAELLLEDPAVAAVRPVPREELASLVEPWLGTGDAGAAIPLPALIDVELSRAADKAEVLRLEALLKDEIPTARVDAQSTLLQPVYAALSALQYLSLGLIVLLAIASSAAVWLASRSAFVNHRETVEIVHLLGGADRQIARVFQRSVAVDAVLGAIAGLGLGLAVMLLVAGRFAALDSGMVAGGAFGWRDWLAIAAIPLAGVLIALMTARITVMSALRRMP